MWRLKQPTHQVLSLPNHACSNCLGSRRVFDGFCSFSRFRQSSVISPMKLDEAVFAAYGWKSDLSDGHPSSLGDATQGMLRKDSGEVTRAKFGEGKELGKQG
jgi:hypothetical protein